MLHCCWWRSSSWFHLNFSAGSTCAHSSLDARFLPPGELVTSTGRIDVFFVLTRNHRPNARTWGEEESYTRGAQACVVVWEQSLRRVLRAWSRTALAQDLFLKILEKKIENGDRQTSDRQTERSFLVLFYYFTFSYVYGNISVVLYRVSCKTVTVKKWHMIREENTHHGVITHPLCVAFRYFKKMKIVLLPA